MQPNDVRIIRGAALPTAAVGLLGTLLGAVVAGAEGALGVALGAVVAAGFFALGLVALSEGGRRWPELLLGLAFLVYTTQIGLLLVLLLVLRDASFLHGRAFAAGVLAGLAAWLAGQVRAHLQLKTLYVEPAASAAAAPVSSGDRS